MIQLAIVLVVAALLHARFLAPPPVDLIQEEAADGAADEAEIDTPSSDGE